MPFLCTGGSAVVHAGADRASPAAEGLSDAGCPRSPITFENRLVQYVGRIRRPHPGKTTSTVHDYHDELTPLLASSLRKRALGYTKLGFHPRKIQK
jgi:hypothetical protein